MSRRHSIVTLQTHSLDFRVSISVSFNVTAKNDNCLIEEVLDPAHHQNLIICSSARGCPVHQIEQKSVPRFLRYPADRQTEKLNYNLLSGGTNYL